MEDYERQQREAAEAARAAEAAAAEAAAKLDMNEDFDDVFEEPIIEGVSAGDGIDIVELD